MKQKKGKQMYAVYTIDKAIYKPEIYFTEGAGSLLLCGTKLHRACLKT